MKRLLVFQALVFREKSRPSRVDVPTGGWRNMGLRRRLALALGSMCILIFAGLGLFFGGLSPEHPRAVPEALREAATRRSVLPDLFERIGKVLRSPERGVLPKIPLSPSVLSPLSTQAPPPETPPAYPFFPAFLAAGLVTALLAYLLVHRLVLARLLRLTEELRYIGETGEQGRRVTVKGKDQLAMLANSVNDLMDALETSMIREREHATRLQALTNNIPGAVYRSRNDAAWTKLYLSGHFQDITGYDPEEFLGVNGRGFAEIVHPDDLEKVRTGVAESSRKGLPFTLEYRIVRPDGSVRWISDRGRVVQDELTEKTWLDGVLLEETERRRALEILGESEARHRAIFENAGSAMILTDEDGRVVMANEEFCRLTGHSRDEVEHRLFWTTFVPPEELPRVLEMTSRRQNAPETVPRRYETRLTDRTGRYLDVIVCTDLIPGSRQQVTSFLDITEIRTVQSALEASERRFREFAESLPQVVFEMDLEGTVLFVNKNAGVTLGYSPEELRSGFNALSIIAPEDRERARNRMLERLRGDDDPTPGEYTGLRRDGSRFPLAVYLRPISAEGCPQGFRGLIVDMTRQKELEERLRFYSLHDPLTGLYSRTFFDEELLRLSAGRDDPVGIVICDLDGLKFLNDTMGHSVGDRILAETAHILRRAFRKNDVLARIGGDEFAALLPRCDGDALARIVETIFRETQRHNESHPALPLSISVGHASGNAGEVRIETLFAAADDHMYRAKNDRRETSRHFLLERLRRALDLREFSDGEHMRRLEQNLLSLAEPLGIPREALQLLHSLAHWHDIGMVTVDESIVLRPGPLAPEEWKEIRRHPETGARIVASFQDLAALAPWILAHHERWDGAGYPLGLKGEEIPLESRMLALVHAYDAMTSPRPWRPARSPEEARAELRRCAGTQFDPRMVELFLALPDDSERETYTSADVSRVKAAP